MNTTDLLWHYTFGQHYQQILADQALKPSAAYLGKDACPVVWFSRNQVWESAATKGLVTDEGTVQNLTMDELRQHGGGLYRFGVARATAPHNWDDFTHKSGMSHDTLAELRRIAKSKSASLKEWFASFDPVVRSQWLAVEIFANNQWVTDFHSQPGSLTVQVS
jgi:hypothetical protein